MHAHPDRLPRPPHRATLPLALAVSASAFASDPPMYAITELGDLTTPANSIAMAISDATAIGPVIAGSSFSAFTPPTLSWRAVAWRPGVSSAPIDLFTIAQAGNGSVNRAQDISGNGLWITGYGNTAPPHGVRWGFDPATGAVTSTQVLLPAAGDGASEGVGINNAGRVAGYTLLDSSSMRGATWAPGSGACVVLGSPAGSGGIRLAREISEAPSEMIVGRSDMGSVPTTRAVIWKKTGPSTYGTGELLNLATAGEVHDATGISPDGTIAVGLGVSGTQAAGIAWDTATNEATAYPPICCAQNVVMDINNAGVGVGYRASSFNVFRAVLWWEGEPFELTDLIVNDDAFGETLFLHAATSINAQGQIVGMFGGPSSPEPLSPGKAYMLTPVARPIPGDLDADGQVDGADITIVLGAWGGCADCGACSADANGDCTVDGADVTVILGNWTG